MADSIFCDQTLAVLVIYEMDPANSSTYISLGNALIAFKTKMDLLIYDNSSHSQQHPKSEAWRIQYEHDAGNGGVSKAYNRAYEIAKERGKRWLWLLDQDDVFDVQSILTYHNSVNNNPTEHVFAPLVTDEQSLVSPFRMCFGGGWRVQKVEPGKYSLNQFLLINSGLLVSLSAFENAGGYSIEFPLDFSDLDFIYRLRKKNNRFVVMPTLIKHSLSINSVQTLEKRLHRFQSYLNAARIFRKKYKASTRSIVIRSFIMAIKLALHHTSFQFIRMYSVFFKQTMFKNVK